MTKLNIKVLAIAIALGGFSTSLMAKEAPIYGSQLMTQQERIEHRNKLHAAKTFKEREKIRLEHHKQMEERAKERGVTLPDSPPMRGRMGDRMGGPGYYRQP